MRLWRKKRGNQSCRKLCYKIMQFEKKVILRPGERIDDLQIKGYGIIQNTDKFCFGMDAVLLSHYGRMKKGSRVMDLCSGTGIVPILLTAWHELKSVEALEYQPDCVEMAERSVKMNGLSELIKIHEGDVKEVRAQFASGSFDYVTCNPPYMTGNHGFTNGNYSKAVARHEILCTLEDVVKASSWLLRESGHFIMVHRPFRLAEIFGCLRQYKLEPKRMRLVYPYVDKEPNMVLIDASKGGKQRITVEPPLIVYEKDGSYTEEVYRVYGGRI